MTCQECIDKYFRNYSVFFKEAFRKGWYDGILGINLVTARNTGNTEMNMGYCCGQEHSCYSLLTNT